MTIEKQLISKTYYQSIIKDDSYNHPIRLLGERLIDEQKSDMPDLSNIRFAQGEVYFINKDFEAAIFKWENTSNELKSWAQKNIADAYYELNLLALAEDYYLGVKTDSDVLKTEVLLQLFSLYIHLGKLDQAADTIKKAVNLNPDYSEVTTLARNFFENHLDWDNAVELAVKEALRTELLSWFEVIELYAEQGHTNKINPDYFTEVLGALYNLDQPLFARLTIALWKSYKQNELYFSWLKEINQLLLNIDLGSSSIWKGLSSIYKETYFELIDGKLLLSEFSYLIPNLLSNWMKLSSATDTLISASAVIAWRDMIPSDIDAYMVNKAGNLVSHSTPYPNGMEEGFKLFETLLKWTEEKDLFVSERLKWMVDESRDLTRQRLLIAGSASSGKSVIVNTLLGMEVLEDYTSAAVVFKDSEEIDIQVVSDQEVRGNASPVDFRLATKSQQSLINFKKPITFLNENQLVLIDTPGLVDQRKTRNNVFQFLHLADHLLFVLNTESHLIGKDLELVGRMKEQAPKLPIHFLLWTKEQIVSAEEEDERIEKAASKVRLAFPDSHVLAISSHENRGSQLNKLSAFLKSIKQVDRLEETHLSKLLYYVKKSIQFLLEQRVEKEIAIIDKIKWNEEMVSKLQGANNQLNDIEEQKARGIKQSYSTIKNELRQKLLVKIPELLRGCSDQVTETSDFGRLHVELNEEMNRRISSYIDETAIQDFGFAIQNWLSESESELKDSQVFLDELCESFNHLLGEEKLTLNCDFRVLDDWRRDMARMTRGRLQLEKVNILMRSTPAQLLLKSAGKLFGALSKNKEMLHNKYKQFIESQDYSPIAESLTNEFMQPFELFEKSLERDINMFFTSPFDVINKTLEDIQVDIEDNNEALISMQKNPEIYRDPLTLFELKVRQLEIMDSTGELVHEYL